MVEDSQPSPLKLPSLDPILTKVSSDRCEFLANMQIGDSFCRCEQICRWFQWKRLDCNLLSNIIPHLRPANAWSWCLQATRDRIKLYRAMQQPRDKHCGRCWKLDHLEEEVATRSIIPLKHNSKSPRVQRKAERICGKQGSTPHLREIYGMVETREFFSLRGDTLGSSKHASKQKHVE